VGLGEWLVRGGGGLIGVRGGGGAGNSCRGGLHARVPADRAGEDEDAGVGGVQALMLSGYRELFNPHVVL